MKHGMYRNWEKRGEDWDFWIERFNRCAADPILDRRLSRNLAVLIYGSDDNKIAEIQKAAMALPEKKGKRFRCFAARVIYVMDRTCEEQLGKPMEPEDLYFEEAE